VLALTSIVDAAAQNAALVEKFSREALNRMLGTNSVEVKPEFADGQLFGCLVEFHALAQDWTYKAGEYIKVGGSFALMKTQKGVSVSLKVILFDLDPRTMPMGVIPSPPSSAYFVSGNATTKSAVVGSYPSDVPGAIFVVLKPEPTFKVILDGLERDQVKIAFARNKGSSDIQLALDTTVVEMAQDGQRSHRPPGQTSLDFAQCAQTLLKANR
jgi:hypothetical protein